jgi:flagellar biosynthesis protein FlhF
MESESNQSQEGLSVNLKTYHAYTMAEALAAVKKDLGSQAVILHTRSFKRGGWLGLGARIIVEVTAGVESASPKVAVAASKPAARAISQNAARRAYHKAMGPPETPITAPAKAESIETSDADRTRRLAMLLAEHHSRQTPRAEQEKPGSQQPPPPRVREPEAPTPSQPPVARRFILQAPLAQGSRPARAASSNVGIERPQWTASSSNVDGSADFDRMRDELTAIRGMVSRVLEQQHSTSNPPVPPGRLFDMYLALIAQELTEELARQVIEQVQRQLTADQMNDASLIRAAAATCLEALVPAGDDEFLGQSPDDRPLTLALIGPTGVGKTTTLAKLAAACKLKLGRRVGLITADTYRIAAVEQLRTYADILGVSLHVAQSPQMMREACAALSDCDVVLIDTAGRSQHDRDGLAEMRAMLDAADPHEVHLVLSSTASEKAMLHEAQAFSNVRVDRIVLTKLDEAVSFGTLVNVMRTVGKKLSFVTTGQEVPDHLEVGRPSRLVDLVLGGDVRS